MIITDEELGGRIKTYRKRAGMTMEVLAKETDCSKSYISQIENGLATPSLSILGRLANALGIGVATLLEDPGAAASSNGHLPLDQRKTIHYPDGNVRSQLLTDEIFNKKMQPLLTVIEPGGAASADAPLVHRPGSEEFILVLKGTLEMEVSGGKVSLKEGDTFYFNGDLPHNWFNNSDETAEVLFVFTPPIW